MNVENLQIFALVAVGFAIVAGIFVIINVQKPAMRLTLMLALLMLGIGAYVYRQNLDDCKPSCSCKLGTMQVPDTACTTAQK